MSLSDLKLKAIISTTSINNNGLIGHPCLIPLSAINQLVLTEIFGSVYNILIHILKFSPKLNLSITLNIK